MGVKILHGGICINPQPFNGFQTAFIDVVGAENYFEVYTGDADFNNKMKSIFDAENPEIVFLQIQHEKIFSHELAQYMSSKGAKIINFTGDKRATVPQWMIDLAPYIYLTTFSNMDDVNYMRSIGFKSDYLEIGYNPLIYTPDGPKAANVPDIVFMGNNYGAGCFPMSAFRIELVNFLRSEYGERFGVYGVGWDNANGNANGSQPDEAALYRAAKIAINCSHFDSLNYNSDRLLRILGSGVCCISYNHKGMFETYGFNVGYFKDFAELKNEIDFYLSNYEDRNKIAISANNFVKNNFTFKHQVENIIKLAK